MRAIEVKLEQSRQVRPSLIVGESFASHGGAALELRMTWGFARLLPSAFHGDMFCVVEDIFRHTEPLRLFETEQTKSGGNIPINSRPH